MCYLLYEHELKTGDLNGKNRLGHTFDMWDSIIKFRFLEFRLTQAQPKFCKRFYICIIFRLYAD